MDYIKGRQIMKKYEFTVIIEKDEDGVLIGTVPQIKGCHTQAKTIEDLMKRIREAIDLCLEVEKDIEKTEFIGIQKIEVCK